VNVGPQAVAGYGDNSAAGFLRAAGAPDISRTEDDLLDLPLLPATQDEAKLLVDIGSITYLYDDGEFKFCAGFAESELRGRRPRALPDDDGCLPGRRSEADYHMAQDRAHVLAARIDEFINAQTDIGGDDPTATTSFVMMLEAVCARCENGPNPSKSAITR